jgi:hypothetical protein
VEEGGRKVEKWLIETSPKS